MQSTIDKAQPSPDIIEKAIDRLNVYDYQLTPQSEIRLSTRTGESMTLRQVHPGNMHLVTKNGQRNVEDISPQMASPCLYIEEPVQGYGAYLFTNQTNLLITDCSDEQFVGCFGTPFRGLGVGRSFHLYGNFGMTSSPVSRLQTDDVLPDTISARAIDIIEKYAPRLSLGLSVINDLTRHRIELVNGMNTPHVYIRRPGNDQHATTTSLQEKVGMMVRGLIESLEQPGSPSLSGPEIMEIQDNFHQLILSQCYHPHSGMTKIYENEFVLPDESDQGASRYRLYALLHLDGSPESFSVKKVSP